MSSWFSHAVQLFMLQLKLLVNYFTSFTFILDFKDGGLGVEGEGGEAGNL